MRLYGCREVSSLSVVSAPFNLWIMDDPGEPQPRSVRTRQRIFRAAAEEILVNGYAGTSLAGIAGNLGLTKGALARHVPVKTALIEEFTRHLVEVLARCDARAQAVFPESPSRACVAFLINVGFSASDDVCSAAGIAMAFDPSVPTASSGGFVHAWIDALSAYLERIPAEDGYELNAPVRGAAEFLTAAFTGMWVTGRFVSIEGRPRLEQTELALMGIGIPAAGVSAIINDVLAQARQGALELAPPEMVVPQQWWRGGKGPREEQ